MYLLYTYDTHKIYTYNMMYCQCVYSSMKASCLWLSLSRHVDANKVSLMAETASIGHAVRGSGNDLFTPTKQVTS